MAHEFERLEQLSGARFDVDACCHESGSNSHCNKYYSAKESFLTATVSGLHCWINAPFRYLHEFIQHYLQNKAAQPESTSACIVVPVWKEPSPWRDLLQNMKLMHTYPVGSHIFSMPARHGGRVPMKGIPWPVEVWHDVRGSKPPIVPSVHAVQLGQVGGRDGPIMTFDANINGSPGQVLMDSGATKCFADTGYVHDHGVSLRKVKCPVHLADGSVVQVLHECTLTVRIQGHKSKVTCYVMDLSGKFSVILGEDWMEAEQVKLDYADKSLQVKKKGRYIHLYPREMDSEPEIPDPQGFVLLSSIQVKRALRRGCSHFMINVIDDGITPLSIQEQYAHPTSPKISALLEKYKDIFKEGGDGLPPDRGLGHAIITEPGAKPPFRPMYRLSPLEMEEVERQVKSLLAAGLIEPSTSPYGASVLFVNKPDGSLRMCLDYRLLNSQTQKNRYPLPRTDQIMDQLRKAKVFSSMDLQSGYYQIRINPEDVPKTAFRTPFGHYQFKVLSMGLTNAPATFQCVMSEIFRKQLGVYVIAYIDDIVVYSENEADHAVHLETVMRILQEQKLFVRLRKCRFEQSEIKFLGHLVGVDGIKVDPAKIAVVKDWPVPLNLTQVQSFLGLATYFRKFIQGFSNLVAPLTGLSKKGVIWEPWPPDGACKKAFDAVKQALTHAPTLAMPDFDKPFEVIADASMHGIGAILMQEGHPIAFESRRMIPAERGYFTTEQELLAVIHALQVWRCYLEGVEFTMITDHHPNTFLQTQPNLSRRHARWSEHLQRYRFKWEYRAGRDNVADPLSRHPSFKESLTVMLCAMNTRSKSGKVAAPPVVAAETAHDAIPAELNRDAMPLSHENEMAQLRAAYALDKWFSNSAHTESLVEKDGLWWKGTQLVIPDIPQVKLDIMWELHDAPYSGHGGITKTLEAVQRLYWWRGITQDVARYVQSCHTCQRNKASNQQPAGLLLL